MATRKKNPAAVALGRKGGLKGGPARAAKLTPEQRSASARKAVLARWAKTGSAGSHTAAKRSDPVKSDGKLHQPAEAPAPGASVVSASDHALLTLLQRLKTTNDAKEIRQLADELERVIFHRQFQNA